MIIYLDQNKWIELAKMFHGKDKSVRAKRVLRDFEAASEGKHVELPLSSFHYIETSRISNVDRKIRLGAVMWRFSRGMTIIGYPAVVRYELESALAKHFPQITAGSISILGRGHAHALCAPLCREYWRTSKRMSNVQCLLETKYGALDRWRRTASSTVNASKSI